MFAWLSMLRAWSAEDARHRILADDAPRCMRVRGTLRLANSAACRRLPETMMVASLDVADCPRLRRLPTRLACQTLVVRGTPIESLPAKMQGVALVDARRCSRLWRIEPFQCDTLLLRGCESLERLPDGLRARVVDLGDCPRLVGLPDSLAASVEHLDLGHCVGLEKFPGGFARLATLNLRGCARLTELPAGMRVRSAIEVADSGLAELPWSLRSTRLFWRGVTAPNDVAFHPELITVQEILDETNVELRRIMLDRIGMERFISQARAEELDADFDAGGPRRLLRIRLAGEENLVCVEVRCPSTGNRYILRVPPNVRSCRQAIAWTAGFTNPDHYEPIQET